MYISVRERRKRAFSIHNDFLPTATLHRHSVYMSAFYNQKGLLYGQSSLNVEFGGVTGGVARAVVVKHNKKFKQLNFYCLFDRPFEWHFNREWRISRLTPATFLY